MRARLEVRCIRQVLIKTEPRNAWFSMVLEPRWEKVRRIKYTSAT